MFMVNTEPMLSCSYVMDITTVDGEYTILNIKSPCGETYYAYKKNTGKRIVIPNNKMKKLLSIVDYLKKVE